MDAPENPRAVIGNNLPPVDPIDDAFTAINDLYAEAKNFADGAAIDSEAMHDTISKLRDQLHEAGKVAEALRVEAKRPLDEQIAAIQDRFNPYVQPKKGKVDIGKSALGDLLAAWRKRVAEEKEAAARKLREDANRKAQEAAEAIRASSGNLQAREDAEALLKDAKQADKLAKREDKAASTGTGLLTVWRAVLVDEEAAMDWAYGRAPEQFHEMVQGMADTVVRAGMRSVPGFRVFNEKVV